MKEGFSLLQAPGGRLEPPLAQCITLPQSTKVFFAQLMLIVGQCTLLTHHINSPNVWSPIFHHVKIRGNDMTWRRIQLLQLLFYLGLSG